MRGTEEKHELFPGSNLCTLLQLTNLSLSLSLPLSVVFAGRSALCQDIMPSLSTYPHQGLSSGNRWGRRPFPCPSKLLKAAHWEPTSTPWPSRKPPTPGKAPTLYTHLTEGANLAWFTCFIFHTCLNVFSLSLSLVWGRMGDSVLCPPPQRGRICPISYCLSGYRRRRQCKKNDPSQCLTVKRIGFETIV